MASIKDVGVSILRDILNTISPEKKAEAAPRATGTNKASIEDLAIDDLRREKIRLDQEERKLLARLREVEAEKRKLFEDGVRNASEREQRVFARRIKEKDVEASNMDRMLQAISKQMRILNGLIQIKESSRMMNESGIADVLKGLDLQDLVSYIDKASVDGEFHVDKFDEIINAIEEADSLSPEYKEDKDVMDIMKAMQQAREAADSPEAMEEQFKSMSEEMRHKEKGMEREDDF